MRESVFKEEGARAGRKESEWQAEWELVLRGGEGGKEHQVKTMTRESSFLNKSLVGPAERNLSAASRQNQAA